MLEVPNKEAFIKLCEERMKIYELAKIYDVSRATISRWIKFYGIDKGNLYFTKEILEKWISTGLSKNKIALELECSPLTLTTYLKKYGLERVKN